MHWFHRHHEPTSHPDVILIGAGIMSATLGVLLKELEPQLKIEIYERLDTIAGESSDAWNNAGTGHSAFCELNYTPQKEDGSIDISKALKIAEQFEISKQFWAYLVAKRYISDPGAFINRVPHMSFVWGDDNVLFLKKRFEMLSGHPLFEGMEYTEDFLQMEKWMPLMMEGRRSDRRSTQKWESMAATRIDYGTDMNFGELTRALLAHLQKLDGVKIFMQHEVNFLEQRKSDGHWEVEAKDLKNDSLRTVEAKFVFIGAGGGSLPLLEDSEIAESKGYGGFPVSGLWLVCRNENVINQHAAKVYGKADVGTPPMSVPHLDTRIISGKKELLFGPFAGFSTKFLKKGSLFDLPASLQLDNILPMISAGAHNLALTKYLIQQVMLTPEERLESLKKFVPTARMEDWVLQEAGQRVQVIRKDKEHGGVLEFGTEVVAARDGSIAALLGASPGASTSVSIMLDVLKKCFPAVYETEKWQSRIREMIPSFGHALAKSEAMCKRIRTNSDTLLKIDSGRPATS